MFDTPDTQHLFCDHCGERLPRFGAKLGFCTPCAQSFRKVLKQRPTTYGAVPPPPTPDPVRGKDPLLSLVLSTVFPGGGQIYNGHFIKAGLVFVTAPLVIPWLIGIADAYFSSRKINERVEELQPGLQAA